MKKLMFLPILCCLVLFASSAYGWEMTWGNVLQVLGPDNATPLGPNCMVQLIADGGNGVVDDPMATLNMSERIQWLADGCPPVGDDFLVVSSDAANPTIIQDYSGVGGYDPAVMDGWFGAVYINSALATPLDVYTRYFTAPEGEIAACDYYGDSGAEEVGQPFQFFSVVPDGAGFVTYYVQNGYTDTHIEIPEPATMLIGGVALLLAFFRRKK